MLLMLHLNGEKENHDDYNSTMIEANHDDVAIQFVTSLKFLDQLPENIQSLKPFIDLKSYIESRIDNPQEVTESALEDWVEVRRDDFEEIKSIPKFLEGFNESDLGKLSTAAVENKGSIVHYCEMLFALESIERVIINSGIAEESQSRVIELQEFDELKDYFMQQIKLYELENNITETAIKKDLGLGLLSSANQKKLLQDQISLYEIEHKSLDEARNIQTDQRQIQDLKTSISTLQKNSGTYWQDKVSGKSPVRSPA